MKKKIALLGLATSILLFSCQKSIDVTPQAAGSVSSDATAPLNVYVAGQVSITPNRTAAVYWKNGQLVTLPNIFSSYATAMYMHGPDRYVTGYQSSEGATYWKNGTPSYIAYADAITVANGIYVSGSSVYAAGFTDYHPANIHAWFWKDGVETPLNNTNTSAAHANGITVSGEDVYTVGYEQPFYNNVMYPRLWKNTQKLTLANSTTEGNLMSVVVNNGNVYAAGWQLVGTNHAAVYWKNGVPVTLSKKGFPAEAHSIFISGSDVYVAGVDNYGRHNVATYWKNGVQITLTNGATDAVANSIAVDGDNNVWVAGTITNPDGVVVAVCWKNGARGNLSKYGQNAYAASIFLSRS